MRPPYCIRGVAPTIAMERGLSILWIDAICCSVQSSMTPPERTWLAGAQAYAIPTALPPPMFPGHAACRQARCCLTFLHAPTDAADGHEHDRACRSGIARWARAVAG